MKNDSLLILMKHSCLHICCLTDGVPHMEQSEWPSLRLAEWSLLPQLSSVSPYFPSSSSFAFSEKSQTQNHGLCLCFWTAFDNGNLHRQNPQQLSMRHRISKTTVGQLWEYPVKESIKATNLSWHTVASQWAKRRTTVKSKQLTWLKSLFISWEILG